MKILKKISISTLFLILVINTVLSQSIQNPNKMSSFAVGPLQIKLSVRPGQTLRSSFFIATRKFSKPKIFTITLMDIGQENAFATIPVEIGKGTKSCARWINITNEVQAKPEDRVEVPFTIKVPRNVIGHYFASIDVSTKPKRPKDAQFAVLLKYRLPVIIELTIPGRALLRLNAKKFIYESGKNKIKPSLIFNVANEGEWKTTLNGDIVLREINTGRQQVVSIPYNPNGKSLVIYPGLEVPIRCEIPNPLIAGDYVATIRMKLNHFAKAQAYFEFSTRKHKESIAKLSKKEEFDLDLAVSPGIIEMPLIKGANRSIPIRIRNNNKFPIDVIINLQKASMELDGSFVNLENINNNDDSWIKISPDSLKLQQRQAKAVKVNITVPKDYKTDYESAYILRIKADRANKKVITGEWESRGEFSVPILVYNATAVSPVLDCTKFEIIQRSKDRNPTAGIIRVKNTGRKLAKIKGIMKLLSAKGIDYANLEIGKFQPEFIMPGKEREFRFEIPTLDDGEFRLIAELRLEGQIEKLALQEERSFIAVATRPEGL